MFCFHVEAELENLAAIRRFVEESARALGAQQAAVRDLVLAADEAASNAILHGYGGRGGLLEIDIEREGSAVVIRLRDRAPPFDPTELPAPDIGLPLEERIPGGLGVFLIRQLMDEVRHRITPEGGNELTLVKVVL